MQLVPSFLSNRTRFNDGRLFFFLPQFDPFGYFTLNDQRFRSKQSILVHSEIPVESETTLPKSTVGVIYSYILFYPNNIDNLICSWLTDWLCCLSLNWNVIDRKRRPPVVHCRKTQSTSNERARIQLAICCIRQLFNIQISQKFQWDIGNYLDSYARQCGVDRLLCSFAF